MVKNGIISRRKVSLHCLEDITSNHIRDFYCLNCLRSYKTKEKLKKYEKVCNNHDYCYLKMLNKYEKILKCNPGKNLLKVPFMIYADLDCFLKKNTLMSK